MRRLLSDPGSGVTLSPRLDSAMTALPCESVMLSRFMHTGVGVVDLRTFMFSYLPMKQPRISQLRSTENFVISDD